ncbi:Recombinase [Desulfosporosinus metallidurans]|uniref:Recombinase n=1 Tax=Desulfosporosinus metallidurans TaxID=1888891 RepID=A0A1Q8R2K7_9FIRM|nr:Recombinase [Desulfosporosinus metallidurans]
MRKIINVVAYVRYSSDGQREESIEAQIRAIKEYAKRNNLNIVAIYIDRAKTATNDNRNDFQKMIADSKLQTFEQVIVHKLDRFARNRYDSAQYKHKLKKNGVVVRSVLETLDGSPESIMMESVLEGMAEYYSANLSREVMKGMHENALASRHTGGKPPLGFDYDKEAEKYIINNREANAVKMIFRMYLDGYGYTDIIKALDENGYKTKVGNSFSKNSLSSILVNEKYTGVYVFNKSSSKDADGRRNGHQYKDEKDIIRNEGGMPEIISKDDFAKARAKMEKNKRIKATYRAKETYLLSGLIVCGECNHAYVGNVKYSGKPKTKHVTYRDGNRYSTGKCDNKEVRREYIEEFVLQQIEEKILSDNAIKFFANELTLYRKTLDTKHQSLTKDTTSEIRKVSTQITNIVELIKGGSKSLTLIEELDRLELLKQNLEIKLNGIMNTQENIKVIDEETIKKILSEYKKHIHDRNTYEVKKFISQFVQKVEIYKDYIKVVLSLSHIIVVTFGGGEGTCTPVSKSCHKSVYACIL